MADKVKTPAGELVIGKKYDFELQHGPSIRKLSSATFNAFTQDGDTRLEAAGFIDNESVVKTVGFLKENILSIKSR